MKARHISFFSWYFWWHSLQTKFQAVLLWLIEQLFVDQVKNTIFPRQQGSIEYSCQDIDWNMDIWTIDVSTERDQPYSMTGFGSLTENLLVWSPRRNLLSHVNQQEQIILKRKKVLQLMMIGKRIKYRRQSICYNFFCCFLILNLYPLINVF